MSTDEAVSSMMNTMESISGFSRPIGVALLVITFIFAAAKMFSPGPRRINFMSVILQVLFATLLIDPAPIMGGTIRMVYVVFGAFGLAPGQDSTSASKPSQPEAVQQAPASNPGMDWSWVPGLAAGLGIAMLAAGAIAGGVFLYRWLAPRRDKRRAEAAHQSSLLEEAKNKLQKVILESARYETDLGLQIEYPMMTDLSETTVSRYVKEMRRAQELERSLPVKPTLDQIRIFSDAVTDLEVYFDAAVAKAEKVRWSGFSVPEKKRLKDAQTALSLIEDSSTTEEQRNAQYKRIVKLLEGLITLTEPVRLALSARVPMLAIGSGNASTSTTGIKVAQPA